MRELAKEVLYANNHCMIAEYGSMKIFQSLQQNVEALPWLRSLSLVANTHYFAAFDKEKWVGLMRRLKTTTRPQQLDLTLYINHFTDPQDGYVDLRREIAAMKQEMTQRAADKELAGAFKSLTVRYREYEDIFGRVGAGEVVLQFHFGHRVL